MYVSSAFVKGQQVWSMVEQDTCPHLQGTDLETINPELIRLEDPTKVCCLRCLFTDRSCLTCGLIVTDLTEIQWQSNLMPGAKGPRLVVFSGPEHRACTDIPTLNPAEVVPQATAAGLDEANLIGPATDPRALRTIFLNAGQDQAMGTTLQNAVLAAYAVHSNEPTEKSEADLAAALLSTRIFDPSLHDRMVELLGKLAGQS